MVIDQIALLRLHLSRHAIGGKRRMDDDPASGNAESRAVALLTQDETCPNAFIYKVATLHPQRSIKRRSFVDAAARHDNLAGVQPARRHTADAAANGWLV